MGGYGCGWIWLWVDVGAWGGCGKKLMECAWVDVGGSKVPIGVCLCELIEVD